MFLSLTWPAHSFSLFFVFADRMDFGSRSLWSESFMSSYNKRICPQKGFWIIIFAICTFSTCYQRDFAHSSSCICNQNVFLFFYYFLHLLSSFISYTCYQFFFYFLLVYLPSKLFNFFHLLSEIFLHIFYQKIFVCFLIWTFPSLFSQPYWPPNSSYDYLPPGRFLFKLISTFVTKKCSDSKYPNLKWFYGKYTYCILGIAYFSYLPTTHTHTHARSHPNHTAYIYMFAIMDGYKVSVF